MQLNTVFKHSETCAYSHVAKIALARGRNKRPTYAQHKCGPDLVARTQVPMT